MKKFLCCLLLFSGFVSKATPINAYANVTAISGNVLTLANINQTYHSFAVGEQVILIQMHDDVIGSNTTNTSSFGSISTIGSAGLYLVFTISGLSGSTMTLTSSPGSQFKPSKGLQVVSYNNLGTNYTVSSAITAVPWNGFVGGVVALQVTGTLTVNSNITADGAGYRGGNVSSNHSGSCDPATYMSPTLNYGYKAEGVHYTGYGGYTARAPLASGGGGGSFNAAGGGGGGNFTAGGTGGGGNSCTTAATQSGGIGGFSLSSYISGGRVFMGGGGGGGQQSAGTGTTGAAGGGIVFISANKIATGCFLSQPNITAEGGTAGNSSQDGAGGAGAGGTVVLAVASYSVNFWCPLNIAADGGDGGNVNNFTAYGGGGGGGQGALLFTAALPTSNISTSTNNGNGGYNAYFGSSASNGAGSNNVGIMPSTVNVLPLDFLSFTAEENGGGDVLDWSIARTRDAVGFTVQRSADGLQFGDIGAVAGNVQADADDRGVYQFTDKNPLAGRNFYRVRMTGVDGEDKYTAVLLVNRVDAAAAGFQIFPNPAHEAFSVQLPEAMNGNVAVSIEDRSGATVYRTVAEAVNGRINVATVGPLAPGLYLLRVSTKDGVRTGKLMLQ